MAKFYDDVINNYLYLCSVVLDKFSGESPASLHLVLHVEETEPATAHGTDERERKREREREKAHFISVSCTEVSMAPREWRKSSKTLSPTVFSSWFLPTLRTLKLTTI